MMHAIRQDVVVLPGGRIEIVSSELTPGAHAQVIVLEEGSEPTESTVGKPGRAGSRARAARKIPPRGMDRRAFMRLPLHERRRILSEQADRLADHYRQDSDLRDLGGGDFVDC